MPIQLAPNVYWVGAIDWNIREFHGYLTEKGSTYNAFLILDDKITLIDTVKKEFVPEMLARIAEIVPPGEDRLYRLQPRGDGPFRRPARGHGRDPAGKALLLPPGQGRPEPPLPSRTGPSSRSRPAASLTSAAATSSSSRPPCSTGRTP